MAIGVLDAGIEAVRAELLAAMVAVGIPVEEVNPGTTGIGVLIIDAVLIKEGEIVTIGNGVLLAGIVTTGGKGVTGTAEPLGGKATLVIDAPRVEDGSVGSGVDGMLGVARVTVVLKMGVMVRVVKTVSVFVPSVRVVAGIETTSGVVNSGCATTELSEVSAIGVAMEIATGVDTVEWATVDGEVIDGAVAAGKTGVVEIAGVVLATGTIGVVATTTGVTVVAMMGVVIKEGNVATGGMITMHGVDKMGVVVVEQYTGVGLSKHELEDDGVDSTGVIVSVGLTGVDGVHDAIGV